MRLTRDSKFNLNVLVCLAVLGLAVSQNVTTTGAPTVGRPTAAPTYAPEWNETCSESTRCEEDLFQCQASSCNLTTFRCQRLFVRSGSACFDWMNETNWDVCEFGVCVGSRRRSTFVEFNTTEGQLDLTKDGTWAQNSRKAVVNFLGLNEQLGQPNVRSCFELNQQPSCSLAAFSKPTPVIPVALQSCQGCEAGKCTDQPPFCRKPEAGKNYTLWFEFVDGNGLSGADLARRVIQEVNTNRQSVLHRAPAYLYQARVSVSPFFRVAAVPHTQEYYLAVQIGVACGIFLIVVLVCFVAFAIKASRDANSFESGTSENNSAASMQSSDTSSRSSAV